MLHDILHKLEHVEQLLREQKVTKARKELSYAIGELETYLLSKAQKADSTNLLDYLEKHAPAIYNQAVKVEKNGRE